MNDDTHSEGSAGTKHCVSAHVVWAGMCIHFLFNASLSPIKTL